MSNDMSFALPLIVESRYGPNNSCLLSNGLDSVEKSHSSRDSLFKSQRDYERHLVGFHLLKHPVYKHPDVKSPLPIPPISSHYNEKPSRKWSVYQSVVNLPAVLNDPNYREVNFLNGCSKNWDLY
ncbi:unnamed protein product [Schistosoma curassoni]|uniref:Uncharacterized protein n=1 Tax=Schistosoma curassoni TaxID=6186 RepID=A0A183JN03_9TREM|nr:unnamed protein product [Schistosoma curassoni]